MNLINRLHAINTRLCAEIIASGLLAFVIVAFVFSAAAPAPVSLAAIMTLT